MLIMGAPAVTNNPQAMYADNVNLDTSMLQTEISFHWM